MALLIIGVLYLGTVAVVLFVLGYEGAQATTAPLAAVAEIVFGAQGRFITVLVALIITVGVLNAFIASMSKLGAALARDGGLPAALSKGHERGLVARRSLYVVALGTALSYSAAFLLQDYETLLLFENVCLISVYVVTMIAAMKLMQGSRKARLLAGMSLLISTLAALTVWRYLWVPLLIVLLALLFKKQLDVHTRSKALGR